MFYSGVKAIDLIEQLKEEVDIAIEIPDETYIGWINSTERLLYTEIIQEQRATEYVPENNTVDLIAFDALEIGEDEDAIRFEDIHAVYVDETQLIKSTVASGVIFPDTYFKKDNGLGVNLSKKPEKVKVVYFVKPKLKGDKGEETIALPLEFMDLLKAKLRGEAYKIANEGDTAAMWINDYNVLLADFSRWVTSKAPEFGL